MTSKGMPGKALFFFCCVLSNLTLNAQTILTENPNGFNLSRATILVDNNDIDLVKRAALLFQQDIKTVTEHQPFLSFSWPQKPPHTAVIIGSMQSAYIRLLVQQKKIDVSKLRNHWEAYQIQLVKTPFKGIDNALVIAGSDRRGTAYGVFELSRQIGVSPWYWWADVPVKKKKEIYIKSTAVLSDEPKVKYRGIFINDEAPAFSGWTKEKFGGVNHLVYEKMFELLLRLKANYLWPAMWGNAFNDDDTLNPILADKWGIVMGTSHHEPMLRAQQEWKRYGSGPWDYTKNDTVLRAFWKRGIQNMGPHESIVTIGMRGDGDMPMTQGTATALLERIVGDQRKIIEEVTGKPASQTPQLWALYKEVQDYYDKGMRVPDDVTLLLCDDNWGNIRRLPQPTDKPRSGGYGIYYHFDYVGGPRNYKWINTNNIARVWEQMHLAYEYGVNKIWIVNVGDLKPMEFPISFFLDYAYNPKKWNPDNLRNYYSQWASEQFGPAYAKEIGEILKEYSQYASRRKPELLDANTFSLANFSEFDKVLKEWNGLLQKAEKLNQEMPAAYKDAYFELILHPVKAFENLYQLYYAVAMNKQYASQKNSLANQWADKAKQFYTNDSLIAIQYNKEIANGKWNHMMDQTHIGYTYWQQPPFNRMPAVEYIKEDSSAASKLNSVNIGLATSEAANEVTGKVFYEKDGLVSMEAEHWTKAVSSKNIQWKIIPDIGKDGSGITTFPVTASSSLNNSASHVEYTFYSNNKDSIKLMTYFSPTLNFQNAPNGLQFAVSLDNEPPQIVSLNKDDNTNVWNSWVANNIIIKTTKHFISKSGKHTVKYWMIDPGIVLQKLVVDFGGAKPSYLGPPETINHK